MGERRAEETAATLCLWRTAGRLLHSGNEPILFLAPPKHALTHPMQNPQLFLPPYVQLNLLSLPSGSVLDSATTTSRVSG